MNVLAARRTSGLLIAFIVALILILANCVETVIPAEDYTGYWRYDHELEIRGNDTLRVSLISQGLDSAFLRISADNEIHLERYINGLLSVDSGFWTWAGDTFRMELVNAGVNDRFLRYSRDTLYLKEIKGLRSAGVSIIDVYHKSQQ